MTDPAAFVRDARAKLGLSQSQFAARVGVNLPTVSRWENGHMKPRGSAIKLIEMLLELEDRKPHQG